MLASTWFFSCWLTLSVANAFPGVFVDESGERRLVHTTHVVIVKGESVSVVTVMIDYEGPRTRFALLLPVPGDVDTRHVQTLRREIVTRVEQVSAPRLHEFYEKDPCDPGPVQQAWEEKLRPTSRGFLTPPMLPPPDASYRVSNEMSVPSRPVFKGEESEFVHTMLAVNDERGLRAKLAQRGFSISDSAAARLIPYLRTGSKLLLSEVRLDRVELVDSGTMQLGGIRYATRTALPSIKAGLGTLHSAGAQDLFVYVLDANQRYESANYPNLQSPTNVAVSGEPRLDLGSAYNALFDQVVRGGAAFVTEYVWPTAGCGEPCPNAALQLRELLSLGGDELEARRSKDPPPKAKQPGEKLDPDEQALLERRALIARQRYLLTRLHLRYTPDQLPRDIELRPAKTHVIGGTGIPEGPSAKLATTAKRGPNSKFQTRFFAAHAWSGTTPCNKPLRWRWGKRWKSMGRVSRRVPLAIDLPRAARDTSALRKALVRPIAGLEPEPPAVSVPPRPAPSGPSSTNEAADSGCALGRPTTPRGRSRSLSMMAALLLVRRRRRAPPQD